MQNQVSVRRWGRTRGFATRLLVLAGFLMPALGLAAIELRGASAATTYCTTSTPDGGNFGSVTYTSYIDAYTDPACSGNRAVAYDVYSSASSVIWINMGQPRLWICGVGPYYGPDAPGANVDRVNVWSGWTGANTCGFQHDVETYFLRSGYGSDVTYTHL